MCAVAVLVLGLTIPLSCSMTRVLQYSLHDEARLNTAIGHDAPTRGSVNMAYFAVYRLQSIGVNTLSHNVCFYCLMLPLPYEQVFKGHFTLPDLGPIGANGLANPRDFK